MTTITIHNKSKLNFNTKAGIIAGGSFLEVEKELAELLLASYPNQLREAANSKKKDQEIKRLKEELEETKKSKKTSSKEDSNK